MPDPSDDQLTGSSRSADQELHDPAEFEADLEPEIDPEPEADADLEPELEPVPEPELDADSHAEPEPESASDNDLPVPAADGAVHKPTYLLPLSLRLGAACTAILIAIVLAVIALFSGQSNPDRPTDPGQETLPAWGEPISADLAFDGARGSHFILQTNLDGQRQELLWLDDRTVLAWAGVEVAAIDLVTGQTKWQLNLLDEIGTGDSQYQRSEDVYATGTGGAAFSVLLEPNGPDPDRKWCFIQVDSGGAVEAVWQDSWIEYAAHGLIILGFGLDQDAPDAILAIDASAPNEILWEAAPTGLAKTEAYLVSDDAFYVATVDGYIDALTGQLLPFGADAVDGQQTYSLTPDGTVIQSRQLHQTSLQMSAIDPKTGQTLWVSSATTAAIQPTTWPGSPYLATPSANTGTSATAEWLLFDPQTGAETGTVALTTPAGTFEGLLIGYQDGQAEFAAWTAGEVTPVWSVKPCADGEPSWSTIQGSVLYVICSLDQQNWALVGLDLTASGTVLWSLPLPSNALPQASADSTRSLQARAGRQYLLTAQNDLSASDPGQPADILFPLQLP
jgi:hypothetical protein